MTITDRVCQQYYRRAHIQIENQSPNQQHRSPNANPYPTMQLIRIPQTRRRSLDASESTSPASPGLWTAAEHERFLEAIERFPQGSWKTIADFVGNKTARQAMTHGQKYRQKIARRQRGLLTARPRRQRHDTGDLATSAEDSSANYPRPEPANDNLSSEPHPCAAASSVDTWGVSAHRGDQSDQLSIQPTTVSSAHTSNTWNCAAKPPNHPCHQQITNQLRTDARSPLPVANHSAVAEFGNYLESLEQDEYQYLLECLVGLLDPCINYNSVTYDWSPSISSDNEMEKLW